MASQLQVVSVKAPGFYGMNEQDSPVDMNINFALEAENCVIDKYGRIASRKGWVKAHTSNADLSASYIQCIGEVIQNNGTSTVVAAGGGFLFKHSGSTLTTLTYGGGGVAPTISANNWQFCQLNGIGIFWQSGYDPLIYDPDVSTTTFRRLSEKSGYVATVQQANTAISAYGRIWCADTSSDKNTVTFSDILTPHVWTGGTAGTLDLRKVWPLGGDEIVTMAAHNGFLFIFGKKQILIYSGADDPATMQLSDSVINIGCIARDSVQNTGEDVIFLSNDGVRSLMRTIQEKSSPMRELSKNVRDEIQRHIANETLANVKSAYSPENGFYLLSFQTDNEIYCFDLRFLLEDGSSRVTDWYNLGPRAMFRTSGRKLYFGMAGYLGEYSGYLDNTSTYRMKYYTSWIALNSASQNIILKKASFTVIGAHGQVFSLKAGFDFTPEQKSEQRAIAEIPISEYGIAEYGIDEYGGIYDIDIINSTLGGYGNVVQLGVETDVNGEAISIQKIDIFYKAGRI